MTRLLAIAAILTLVAGAGMPVFGQGRSAPQKSFAAPGAAVKALGAAYEAGDRGAVAQILGDSGFRLVSSGDEVIDRHERAWFLSLYREGHKLVPDGKNQAELQLGKEGQPYPIPLVKESGRWRFDKVEGHEDLLSRRISKAELSALNMVLAYVDAQRRYFRKDYNGDGVREYAPRLRATEGQQDGLWWKGQSGKAAGPIAALVQSAGEEGYAPTKDGHVPVYRGYYYSILQAQGPNAPGGAREYIVDGRMTGGFAMIAYPARYGVSGIVTFLVNQEGVVYQKDLGPDTVEIGRKMSRFDPDASWSKGKKN